MQGHWNVHLVRMSVTYLSKLKTKLAPFTDDIRYNLVQHIVMIRFVTYASECIMHLLVVLAWNVSEFKCDSLHMLFEIVNWNEHKYDEAVVINRSYVTSIKWWIKLWILKVENKLTNFSEINWIELRLTTCCSMIFLDWYSCLPIRKSIFCKQSKLWKVLIIKVML